MLFLGRGGNFPIYLSAMGNSKNCETRNLSLNLGTESYFDKFFLSVKLSEEYKISPKIKFLSFGS